MLQSFVLKTNSMPGKILWAFVDLQPPMIVMHVVNQSWINYCDHLFRFGYFYSVLTCPPSPPCCQLAVCVWFVLAGLNVTAIREWRSLARAFSSQSLQLHCLWNNQNTRFWHKTYWVDFCSGHVVVYWRIRMMFLAEKCLFDLSYKC